MKNFKKGEVEKVPIGHILKQAEVRVLGIVNKNVFGRKGVIKRKKRYYYQWKVKRTR